MKTFLISAGEVSGDMYGARVVKKIKERRECNFLGIGGPELAAAGVEILENTLTHSTYGFSAPLSKLGYFYRLGRKLAGEAQERKVAAALLVDFTGFNMYLALLLRRRGIPALHYIPPGVWFWGQWRASFLARQGVAVASIFPQEAEIYREKGVSTFFVGHPLLPQLKELRGKWEKEKRIALLPGSRTQEVRELLPPMVEAAGILKKKMPDMSFSVSRAPGIDEELLKPAQEAGLRVHEGSSRELLARSTLAITASGTATLEAALLGTPAVIVYRVDSLTYFLGKLLARVEAIGLPNLILGENILPELLQQEVNGTRISQAVMKIWEPDVYEEICERLAGLEEILGWEDPADRVGEILLELGEKPHGS